MNVTIEGMKERHRRRDRKILIYALIVLALILSAKIVIEMHKNDPVCKVIDCDARR